MRLEILEELKGKVLELCLNLYGCRVIQRLLEVNNLIFSN
jgi:hypothetical protein